MDGRGRWLDNVFVERLWRSLKYEEIYLNAYESVQEARTSIGQWFNFYNYERQHQALGYKTPYEVYEENAYVRSHEIAAALKTGTKERCAYSL